MFHLGSILSGKPERTVLLVLRRLLQYELLPHRVLRFRYQTVYPIHY